MPTTGRGGKACRQLWTLFNLGALGALTDRQLLERFLNDRGEAAELAFAALVERHGAMVLRVCRGVLRDEHEAHDAFQATFLVLVQRSNSLWVSDSLGPWLHGVARRVASCARAAATRRRRHERLAAEAARTWAPAQGGESEIEGLLHDEIARLPERYRIAVVLCLLEGRTHEQAARDLGWPLGTVKSRLAQGRARLRDRLIRRGLAPSVAISAAFQADRAARAAVPAALAVAVCETALRIAAGRVAAGTAPTAAAAIAAAFLRRTLMIRLSLAIGAIVTLGAAGIATSVSGQPVSGVKLLFIDLQPMANHDLDADMGSLEGNNLARVPRGYRKLAGTPFRIGQRFVRVRGRNAPEPPAAVRGIPLSGRCEALHFLQSTMFGSGFGVADGDEVGAYTVHYADGTSTRVPIIYGRDVRDWWFDSDPQDATQGRTVWAGGNRASDDEGGIRLFATEWKNPYPEKRLASIDLETADTACAPFLVALTSEESL